jgi:uncharacterized protein (DUF1501 family)
MSRRRFLRAIGAAAGALALPRAWAQAAPSLSGGRFVLVFLRGAYDGLSATVPWSDPDYARDRPNTALPAPDGGTQSALKLDAAFALHPALAPLLPLWRERSLAFIPCAGSPDPTRSHFDAQLQWEIGMPGRSNAPRGWLNALAQLGDGRATVAIGVGEANPKILSGPAPVRLIPRGNAAAREGVLANDRARTALLDLYGGDDAMSRAFREGADSRMASAQALSGDAQMREMQAADNGAAPPAGLLLDAQHLGLLMRGNRRLRLGFLSAGGWDTHANQGAVTGQLANNLRNLGLAIAQLRRDFAEPGDVVAVVSEFGRTTAENGTRGTDHGHGNTLWLMGTRIAGGRWHGDWAGLAAASLHEGRDLPVRQDFRAVFAQVLGAGFGLRDENLQDLFPGARLDPKLAALLRAA